MFKADEDDNCRSTQKEMNNIIKNVTLEQAIGWDETDEKWLYCSTLLSTDDDRFVDKLERKFCRML